MPIVKVETYIQAPPELCFDLARDVNAHTSSTAHTGERIVYAPPGGLLELGDEVEFEATHFGIKQRLRSRIVAYDRPHRFVDEMQRGAFKRLRHTHEFHPTDTGTTMVDILDFAAPIALVNAFLANYMKSFLERRNKELKRMAEERA